MRVLLINPSFYPSETPRAYRWTRICEELVLKGHTIDVVTSASARSPNSNIKVYGVGSKHPGHSLKTNKGKGSKMLARIGKYFYRKWMWPDESMFWARKAEVKIKSLIQENHYDVCISVSLPMSSHLATYDALEGQNIPWKIDIGDPFVHHDINPRNNLLLHSTKNRELEKNIFYACDEIHVTNHALMNFYQKVYPSIGGKLHVTSHVHSPLPKNNEHRSQNPKLLLGYFGSFYNHVREPDLIIKFIQTLNQLGRETELHIYGNTSSNNKLKISSKNGSCKVLFFESVKRSQVVAQMRTMDVLINIDNNSEMQLPSKIADYLISGRPIIQLGHSEGGPFENFCQEFAKPLILNSNQSFENSAIMQFLDKAQHTEVDARCIQKFLEDYSMEKIAAAFIP